MIMTKPDGAIVKMGKSVKWVFRMIEIRWMSSDVNRPDGVDG